MPIAAVPNYLGQNLDEASPGLRFGLYLKLWGIDQRSKQCLWKTSDTVYERRGEARQERAIPKDNKTDALKEASRLGENDHRTMQALLLRQKQAFQAAGTEAARLVLDTEVIAPFATGLGNEHPLENGFAFLNPYGLPYLPGSGVKGVVRRAAEELAEGCWGGTAGWSHEPRFRLRDAKEPPICDDAKVPVQLSLIELLFGREDCTPAFRGVLHFWDVIPQTKGNALQVEVMTPHHGHYYQQMNDDKSGSSITPHDSGLPNPIAFLTVPPRAQFVFHVTCDLQRLRRIAPDLAENAGWKALVHAAMQHAFEWLGFGAKTAVGYGAMQVEGHAPRHAPAGSSRYGTVETSDETELRTMLRFNKSTGGCTVQIEKTQAPVPKPLWEKLKGQLSTKQKEKAVDGKLEVTVRYTRTGNAFDITACELK